MSHIIGRNIISTFKAAIMALRNGLVPIPERCGSVVISTSACHAAGRGSISGPGALLGVKTWLSTLEIV